MTSHPPSDPKPPPERAFVRVGTHVEFAEAMPPVGPAVSLDTQACDLEIAKNATLYNIKSFSPSSDLLNSVLRNLAGELVSGRNQSIQHAATFRKATTESRRAGNHIADPPNGVLRTPHKKVTLSNTPPSYTPPRPFLLKATTPASSSFNYNHPHLPRLPPPQPTPQFNFNLTNLPQSQSTVTRPQENISTVRVHYDGSSFAQAYGDQQSFSRGTNYPLASGSAIPYNYTGEKGI